jgi:membrane protein DedA with SNARE-associated domain
MRRWPVVDRFLDWVARLPETLVYLVLMALSALENIFPPVPADVAVVLGAFLAQRGVTEAPLLGALCWMANTGSSAAMYFYARRRGRKFFAKGWRRKLMPPEAIADLERAYLKHGVAGIFISRFLPGVRAAVTPFAGVVGMSPVRALVPAAVASAIWYAILVGFGSFLGVNWETARRLVDDANRVLGGVALLATAAFVYWLWRRRRTAEG